MNSAFRLTAALVLFAFIRTSAQQVVQAEYFFDTDQGVGQNNPLPMAPGDTVLFSAAVPVAGLAPGYHYLYVRTKNDQGAWGMSAKRRLYIFPVDPPVQTLPTQIIGAECFYGSDPGPGNGTALSFAPGDTIVVTDTISSNDFQDGIMIISLRANDSNGLWCFPIQDTIYKGAAVSFKTRSRPITRPGSDEAYELVLTNEGSATAFDLLTSAKFTYEENSYLVDAGGGQLSVPPDSVPVFFQNGDLYHSLIWVDSIVPGQEVILYLHNTTTQFGPHEIIPQQFVLHRWYDDEEETQTTPDLSSTKLYSLLYNVHDHLSDSLPLLFTVPDTLLHDSLIIWLTANRPGLTHSSVYHVAASLLWDWYGIAPSSEVMAYTQPLLVDWLSPMPVESRQRSADAPIDCSELPTAVCRDAGCPDCPPPDPDPFCGGPLSPPLADPGAHHITGDFCEPRCPPPAGRTRHNSLDIGIDREWNGPGDTYADNIDIDQWESGTMPITSVSNGIVAAINSAAGPTPGSGRYVEITCGDRLYRYLHMAKISDQLSVGQSVTQGSTVIGTVGTSGTTKRHLHIEIKRALAPPVIEFVDPECLQGLSGLLEHSNQIGMGCKPCDGSDRVCAGPENILPDDPNIKIGPDGYSVGNWTHYDTTYYYAVFFENDDSASASAQHIVVRDTIDMSLLDPGSFRHRVLAMGHSYFDVPEDFTITYKDTLDTRVWNSVLTALSFSVDTISGAAEWSFEALDTLTLQPVTDPLLGILPPDTLSPTGTGLVSYSMRLRADVQHGALVSNQATILFDTNDPITTAPWTNTVDRVAPESSVDTLPAISLDTVFTVSWSGTDDGAGIEIWDVYYAVNGDTLYEPWLQATSDTSAIFIGAIDSTYHFYSIATDSVGNREVKADTSEAYTIVTLGVPVGSYQDGGLDLHLFPNPSTGIINLRGYAQTGCTLSVTITNALGQTLAQRSQTIPAGRIDHQVDLTALAPGSYIATITCNDSKLIERLIRLAY